MNDEYQLRDDICAACRWYDAEPYERGGTCRHVPLPTGCNGSAEDYGTCLYHEQVSDTAPE